MEYALCSTISVWPSLLSAPSVSLIILPVGCHHCYGLGRADGLREMDHAACIPVLRSVRFWRNLGSREGWSRLKSHDALLEK